MSGICKTLSERMKKYEAVTTETNLIERLPIYARIDMRAGHSWCKGLKKPFDDGYSSAMQHATAYIVEKTGAAVGYTQSDEASFVWEDSTKVPFETRLFKLQSVLASMFTGAFISHAMTQDSLAEKIQLGNLPAFDCRVLNMPSLAEAANMILWRERDSIKNSITLLALEHFSNGEIHKKNSAEKIQMLKELKNVDYYTALSDSQQRGAYFRRETFQHVISAEDVAKIPEKHRPPLNSDGTASVTRSKVVEFNFKVPLDMLSNKAAVLFEKADPEISDKVTKGLLDNAVYIF